MRRWLLKWGIQTSLLMAILESVCLGPILYVQARFAGLATDPAYAKYYTGYSNGYVEFHIV